MLPKNTSFYIHIFVEVPASLAFLFNPSGTLAQPQPFAHAVIRQYGILLFCMNLTIILVLCHDPATDEIGYAFYQQLEQQLAAVLALYHFAPLFRALTRIHNTCGTERILTGPWMHMALHTACLGALLAESLRFARG